MDNDQRLLRKLEQEMGPAILDALADPACIEILLNPDGRLWVERFGEPMQVAGSMTGVNALAMMGTIADALGTVINRNTPILEGELPGTGSRFEGLMPPVVAGPTFTIRKKASRVFTLADYVRQGVMTERQQGVLEQAITDRSNMLVVGGTGSGKTTLTNAVIAGIVGRYPDDRLVIIEDTAEIQCAADNAVLLRASLDVSMQQLLKATMRLRPDRILVGEVRGGEALALLKAWNTGHPGGVATLHANDARAGLVRLEQLVSEAGVVQGVPALIGAAVNLVVVIARTPGGRKITELLAVHGYVDGRYVVNSVE
ncbi:MAG: P-type conjugative transfer ATPase TrbB [Thiothrix sp.]|nr:P-type conjugative transfer ATPase TrbB [Thiothrix sp.]